jgi:alanine-synthesizing transaminase
MFSSRFHWDLRPNRLTQLLEIRRGEGARILDLTESNPTHAGLSYPAGIAEAFADPRILHYEPLPAGAVDARQAVARYYAARGCTVDIGRILLTASTSEAYAYLFKLLADPGDQVLVPRPSYPLFEFLATMESLDVRQYPLAYHGGWSIDLDALEAAVTDRTRAIVLVNPNNPTGSFIQRAELAALTRLAAARRLALISDEVFSDYAFSPDADRVATLADVEDCLAFSMSGLSKVAGLPQMKLGWIVVRRPGTPAPRSHGKAGVDRRHVPFRGYAGAVRRRPVIGGRGRSAAPGPPAHRSKPGIRAGRWPVPRPTSWRWKAAGTSPLQVPRIRSEEEWALDLLARRDVLVQPGFFYDFDAEAFLIVSLLTSPEIFREGQATQPPNSGDLNSGVE